MTDHDQAVITGVILGALLVLAVEYFLYQAYDAIVKIRRELKK